MKKPGSLILRDLWDGMRTQPGKVGLSYLAMVIGISTLIVLMALLGGLKERSRRILNELGVNVIGLFQAGATDRAKSAGLEERHALMLAANLPECSVSTVRRYNVPTLGTKSHLTVVATDSALPAIRQWPLEDGRFLDKRDLEMGERHAVVSRSLSRLWDWKVGNLIMLRDLPFRIVGLVDLGGTVSDNEFEGSGLNLGEYIVFVPKTVTPYWTNNPLNPKTGLDAIFLQFQAREKYASVLATVQDLLDQPDYRVKELSWVTPETLTRQIKKLERTIRLTLGSIVGLCLILGGTTLMSLMVSNVRERKTEIGLRRALGASQWDIASLFVLEAGLITGAAAVTAVLITHALLFLGRSTFPVPLQLGWESVLIPFTTALFLSLFFSYWPALSAAKISPAEALRNE